MFLCFTGTSNSGGTVIGNQNSLSVDTVRYLAVYFASSKKLKCSLDQAKRSYCV